MSPIFLVKRHNKRKLTVTTPVRRAKDGFAVRIWSPGEPISGVDWITSHNWDWRKEKATWVSSVCFLSTSMHDSLWKIVFQNVKASDTWHSISFPLWNSFQMSKENLWDQIIVSFSLLYVIPRCFSGNKMKFDTHFFFQFYLYSLYKLLHRLCFLQHLLWNEIDIIVIRTEGSGTEYKKSSW